MFLDAIAWRIESHARSTSIGAWRVDQLMVHLAFPALADHRRGGARPLQLGNERCLFGPIVLFVINQGMNSLVAEFN